jgi:nucleotide-binding universal stress UspA family protein
MSVKSTLVPIGAGEPCRSAVVTAFLVSKSFNAHVHGLHVGPIDTDLLPFFRQHGLRPDAIRELMEGARREAEDALADARRVFDEVRQTMGVEIEEEPVEEDKPTAGWETAKGLESEVVAERGRVFDMVICGRPVSGQEHPPAATVETALFQSGRPVLVAPPGAPQHIGESVLIGWNRSAHAARAVAAAMPFIRCAANVTILHVDTGAKAGPPPEHLARRLAWHGVDATVRNVAPGGRGAAEVIHEQAKAVDADLLVMGAYTHSRFREAILGGVTRYVLNEYTIPVLFSH